jgi:CheY-like chemotaxis protein
MAEVTQSLEGLRILVVEDNFLLAETLRMFLDDCGSIVVGPVGRVAAALAAADATLDGALLDINLAGEYCFPIAEKLRALKVPFVFVTGYDGEYVIPPEFRNVLRLSKPFDHEPAQGILARYFRPG